MLSSASSFLLRKSSIGIPKFEQDMVTWTHIDLMLPGTKTRPLLNNLGTSWIVTYVRGNGRIEHSIFSVQVHGPTILLTVTNAVRISHLFRNLEGSDFKIPDDVKWSGMMKLKMSTLLNRLLIPGINVLDESGEIIFLKFRYERIASCCGKMTSYSHMTSFKWSKRKKKEHCVLQVSAISYQDFIQFALNETKQNTLLLPSPLQEKYSSMTALDGQTRLEMESFESPRIRLLRSMSIEGEAMQVFDFAAFPKPEFDVPIFCGNFFTAANTNIVVLDLNPLHDVTSRRDYKEKYYDPLMPLGLKYTELLPWGGKLTSESIKFFSPIVIWTKFNSSKSNSEVLYSAFVEYYKAWMELMGEAVEQTDPSQIMRNLEAQHRYLTWRAEKDPGHRVLKRLIGEKLAKDLLRNFLFSGIDELGSKTFLDYFPEYWSEDGTVNEKRSIIGKGFEKRPWDKNGEFVGNDLRN